MGKQIASPHREHLESRSEPVQSGHHLTWRGFWVGSFLSFFLAVGAPYGNMIIKGAYLALDISTPGAIFLFLLLIGLLNLLFKLASGGKWIALLFALFAAAAWLLVYWPLTGIDPLSPGLIFSTFLLVCALANLPVTWAGRSLALNRGELIMVYAMLAMVSAVCTMGLIEQLLPTLTAIFYYASPENQWREKLFPLFPERNVLVDDGAGNAAFYEGLSVSGQEIPYGAWAEPLAWWAVFLLALYVCTISMAVILRRQWMERERLAYPIAQAGLEMIRGEEAGSLVNSFFRQPSVLIGMAVPFLAGGIRGLSHYFPSISLPALSVPLPFTSGNVNYALVGFSYLIDTRISAGVWVFFLLARLEKAALRLWGIKSDQVHFHGVSDSPLVGYQGLGALLVLVLAGLWTGREHLKAVWLKALGRAPDVDDSDEILPYRGAVAGTLGGAAVMTAWLAVMGTPLWVSLVFVVVALLIFTGVSRIIAEAGLATLRAPITAPDFVVMGLGPALVGPTGVFNLSLAYIWGSEVRAFAMATCTNALKLIEEMDSSARRLVSRALLLALVIGALGSFWMTFHMAYRHGGVNLDGWFFKAGPGVAYDHAARNLEPAGIYWPGMGFLFGGGGAMALLMLARQRLSWWPLHPVGFPVAATNLMNGVVTSVFLAWAAKVLVLRFGGASGYRRSRSLFLGMIAGQMLAMGFWLVVDYFAGGIGNRVF
ncbi:MAG: hypothetical protein OXH50_10570 [Gemmatimonadetes bacterium]|nr:hypothetical protein [Gemmatimonadota bacterium]